MSSNLHPILDNAQLHPPLDFAPADFATHLTKDQTGALLWDDMTYLPPVLNIVSGALAPPTEILGDRYIITGGIIHADWDGLAQNDIAQFDGTSWIGLTATIGMILFNYADDKLYYFASTGAWTDISAGGGGGIITAFTNQANNRLVFCDTVSNTIKAVTNMTNLGIMGLFINAPLRVSGLARFDGNIRFDGQLAPPIHDLGTTSGFVPVSFANGMAQKIELDGNATMMNPIEIVEGNAYRLIVRQDGVGGHTFTLGANYTWTGGVSPAIPSGAGDGFLVDMLGISGTEIMATLTAFQ